MEELSSEQVAEVLGDRACAPQADAAKAHEEPAQRVPRLICTAIRVSRRPPAPAACEQMTAHIEACPECVALLKGLRAAVDQCRTLSTTCDPAISDRMRKLMTAEYLRLVETQPQSLS